MRLWSLHPKYLDSKGLVALWRESLLAKAVLEGKTSGYRNHPQLQRFIACPKPVDSINTYLSNVLAEASARGYRFDASKIDRDAKVSPMPVTSGQVEYEYRHLLAKLEKRDPQRYMQVVNIDHPEVNPVFRLIDGEIEAWERI